jgi:protein gp37
MTSTKIEWTNQTWNPTTGCTKLSSGCVNCYAEKLSNRLKAMRVDKYKNGFDLTLHRDIVKLPLKWKTPSLIFVNSMSDLFHEDIPDAFIFEIFHVMSEASWHTFQILTKRSSRLLSLSSSIIWPSNVWMGVTIEESAYKYRIDELRETDAKIKFLSVEPLLGPIPEINLQRIDWVIVGGESGPKARPIKEEWVKDIRDQCLANRTLFFFKQWGGFQKKKNGRVLEGKIWNEKPAMEIVQVS